MKNLKEIVFPYIFIAEDWKKLELNKSSIIKKSKELIELDALVIQKIKPSSPFIAPPLKRSSSISTNRVQ